MSINDKMRVVSIAGATGGGTQNLTIPGFGTPDAAIIFTIRATANSKVDGAGFSVGFTDGVNEFVSGVRARHGTANEESDRLWSDGGELGWLLSTGADPLIGDADFSFSSWVTDGIQISWNTAPGTAIQVIAILIQCANAQVGKFTSSNTLGVPTTVTMSPGFPPQTVFIAGNDSNEPSATTNLFWESVVGIADYNGSTVTQGSMNFYIQNGESVGDPRSSVWDGLVRRDLTQTEGVELENFTSTSFDATAREGNSFNFNIGYLALEWNGAARKVAIFDSPTGTATINKSFTWPGFKPQCVIHALTMVQSVDTNVENSDGGSQAIGAFDLAGGEECIAWADENAAATINSESSHASQAIELNTHTGAALFKANLANGSMDPTGYTLQFTAIPSATPRKWLGFALAATPLPEIIPIMATRNAV